MRERLYKMECRVASYFSEIGTFCMDWATWFFAFFLKKDLGKVLLPKAVEWVRENVRIVERAGLKFYVFDKKIPLFMRLALGKESEYDGRVLQPVALDELFPYELNDVSIWRDSCGIRARGSITGPLDFRKIDGTLLRCNPGLFNSGKFNYKVKTTDQVMDLIVESLDKTDFAEELPSRSHEFWFKKLWGKFYNWMHEFDYEKSRKWLSEHIETMTIECRHGEIKVMMLYDDCPQYVKRYLDFPDDYDIIYMSKFFGVPAIFKFDEPDWLDFRKLPKEVTGILTPTKNDAFLTEVLSPTRLAKIIKDIE
ncbi:hypothetical protein J6Y50_04055 [bacterium]|nr:hypothetical protein [bacterium]